MMNEAICKPCEPVEEKKTMCGMDTEMKEVLFKTHDMLGQIIKLTTGNEPMEINMKEPSCLMEEMEINLENARIIAHMSFDILRKFTQHG